MNWNAENIKKLREQLGWTQIKLAEKLGVNRNTINRWEIGKRSPGKLMRSKLDDLVSGIKNNNDTSQEIDTSGFDTKVVSNESDTSDFDTSFDTKLENGIKTEDEMVSNGIKNSDIDTSFDTKLENGIKTDGEMVSNGIKNESDFDTRNENGIKTDDEVVSNGIKNDIDFDTKNSDDTGENDSESDSNETNQTQGSGDKLYEPGQKRERKRTGRRSAFVQGVLDQIPIEGEIGKDVQLKHSGKKFSGLCPFHNDTHPSFEVYPHTQSWFCYGCQKGGSLIDYVMYRDSITPAEAIRRLCETYDIPQPAWNEKEKAEWENTKQEKELISEINLAVFKWYHDKMPKERREYYLRRGIIDGAIDKEVLGYAPDNDAILGEMLKHYKAEQLVASGLFTVVSGCLEPIYKRRYVIPYWEDCKIVYSIGRLDTDDPNEIAKLPEWNRGKYKKQLTHSSAHPEVSKVVKNVIWNADCVGDYEIGSIAEGIIDGILHKQISDEIGVGVISPVTTKFSNNDLEQLVNVTSHWEKVYCIADNEVSEAGIKGAVQTAKTLFNAGRNPYIVLPPRPDGVEKADLADYLNVPPDQKDARTTEFAQLLSSSPPLLDYLISQAESISGKKERNEKITEIIGLMVSLGPLELEDYKETFETQFGVKRGVFKSLVEKAKHEKEEKERKKAQEELKKRTVNVEAEQPTDERTLRRYGDVMETEEGYAQVSFSPTLGMQVETISSFLIKPKSRLWIDDYEAVSTDLVTKDGKTYPAIFERHHWNELNAFLSRLPSIDLVWQGKLEEVQAVMGIVNSFKVPVQKGTRQLGWYNVGTSSQRLMWVAKDINISKDGFLSPPEVLYCPYSGELSIENAISFKATDDATFKQQCDLAKELVNINEPNVILPIIGWFFAAPFKWHFLNHPDYRHFPHLNIWGTRGSGKSGMAKLLWRMFGYTASDLPSASQTRFALLRMFTSTNSYPICIDEYKPYDMKVGSPEAVRHFMRLSYDGMMDFRGRPDQSVVSYRVVAPVCLIGESPIDEPALMERIIPATPSPVAIDKERNEGKQRRELFYKLNETNWEGFLVRYLRHCLEVDFKKAHDNARGNVLYYLHTERNGKYPADRILDNLVCFQFGVEQYASFVGISYEWLDDWQKAAILNATDLLCGEGGVKGRLSVETMLEQLSIMAETKRLTYSVHYVINKTKEGQTQICLRLPACLAEFRRFARETNWHGEVLSDSAYQRQLRDLKLQERIVLETSALTSGWEHDKRLRVVVINAQEAINDGGIDLSGFSEPQQTQ
jgi:DNA primase catalytic core